MASLLTTLYSKPLATSKSWLKDSLLIVLGSLLLALTAQLSIPLQPVPITFQSTTVLLIGMLYGPVRGSAVIALYLLEGACGLPVFANFASGLKIFLEPTVGYIVGFLPAVVCAGYLSQKGWTRNVFTSFITATLGVSLIFACGILGLAQILGWHNAITVGLLPFLITEPVKLLALALFAPRVSKQH